MRLPVMIEHPAITKAAEHHAAMVRQRDEAKAQLGNAKRSRPTAVAADQDAYAKAIASGKADPGEKRTVAADEAIRQAERKVAALDKAAATAEAAIEQTVSEHREAISGTLANRLTTVDRAYAEAVEAWEAAAQTRGSVLAALEWMSRGDMGRPASKVGGWIPGLRVRQRGSGDQPAMVADVARAMREVTAPPEETGGGPGVGGSMAAFLGVEQGEE